MTPGDDPFHDFMTTLDEESSTKRDGNFENSHEVDNVVVEDASTDEEKEGSDGPNNACINDEMNRSFVIEELFPTKPVADDDEVGTTALTTFNSNDDLSHGHFSPEQPAINVEIAKHDTKLNSYIYADTDGETNLQQVGCLVDEPNAAAESGITVLNPFDIVASGSVIQQQETTPEANTPTPAETKNVLAVGDGDDINISSDQIGDELLLSFLDADKTVASNQLTCPAISPWQQEQQQLTLEQQDSNLLDIPISIDYSHSYLESTPAEDVTDTNLDVLFAGDTNENTNDHIHRETDGTATTTNLTEVDFTNENEKVEEESWATHDTNVYDEGTCLGSNRVRIASRDLEVNYAFDTTSNKAVGDDKSNYHDGKRKGRQKRNKFDVVIDSDEEQPVRPGMVAYTQLEKEDNFDRRNKSYRKKSYKFQSQRRCIAVLCVLVVVLLALISGLLYHVIASPRRNIAGGSIGSGNAEFDTKNEESGLTGNELENNNTQNDIEVMAVHGGKDDHESNTGASEADMATNMDDTIINLGSDENTGAETIDSHSEAGNITVTNATILNWDSSTSLDNFTGDSFYFEYDSPSTIELSLVTSSGEALVSSISKSYGIVFDIESLVASLTITGMDLYLDTSFESRYEVWMADGSWRDGAEFVEIAHGTINGTGVCRDVDDCAFSPIPSDEFDVTTITAGRKRSFWVTLRDDDLVSHNRFVGHKRGQNTILQDYEDDTVYASNAEMRVYYGTSILAYPIQLADQETEYRQGRGFIGNIRYKVAGAPDNFLTEPFDFVEATEIPVVRTSEIPSARPSTSPTNGCHYTTEEACRDKALELGLHIGGAGFPFAGPYPRAGCYFYSCSNCLFGGIAYFGTKGDYRSTKSVHSERRLDCNTKLYSLTGNSPFWCLFPTTMCAG